MSIVPSNRENEQNVIGAVLSFMQVYHLSALLRKCGCKKEQGISFVQLKSRKIHTIALCKMSMLTG